MENFITQIIGGIFPYIKNYQKLSLESLVIFPYITIVSLKTELFGEAFPGKKNCELLLESLKTKLIDIIYQMSKIIRKFCNKIF